MVRPAYVPPLDDNYAYVDKAGISYYKLTRQEWLNAIVDGRNNPKPPQWWVTDQQKNGRTETAAYVIWTKHYKPDRKYVIWDQAHVSDFSYAGYRFG